MSKMGLRASLVLAASLSAAVAAACAPAAPAPSAQKPAAPAVRGAPALDFDTLAVDMGMVPQDQMGVQTFVVMNRGDKPLRVGPVSIDVEQGCATAKTVEKTTDIQPNDAVLLPITFSRHTQLGPHRLLVKVPSNDPAKPMTTLSLRFAVANDAPPSGSGPRLQVDKGIIDVGTVPYDWPMYEQFTLRNVGTSPLVLNKAPVVRVEQGC
ncbi:MAG: DUF1573 domain-containing protein [Dehalococcoidia bacterium]|nr:DUF1573 domain-containing protein [Dehalococcoidia bacterium]